MNNTVSKLASHPHFRWGDGALALRWAPGYADHLKVGYRVDRNMVESGFTHGLVPDLNDPATIGTIEAQVRAADPNSWFVLSLDDPGFWVERQRGTQSDALAVGSRTIGEAWALAFLEVTR